MSIRRVRRRPTEFAMFSNVIDIDLAIDILVNDALLDFTSDRNSLTMSMAAPTSDARNCE